jgi:alpha-1,3-rhamnosyl/mannosyltransferase
MQYPLVIAGHRGWLNHDLNQALTSVPKEYVRLLGYLPQQAVPAITAGAKALVYASHYEGFGLPPLEAMACGVPVISSNAQAMQEVIEDAGIIIDTQDVEGFTKAMRQILEDDQLAHHYKLAGLRRANDFSWKKCAQQTYGIYESLLK